MRCTKSFVLFITTLFVIALLALATSAWAAPTFKVLHSFSGSDGSDPWDALLLDSAGNLYGTTHSGGAGGNGTVFKLTSNEDGSWTHKTLHSFTGADGAQPMAGLIKDAAGNLYGTTYAGGANGGGTVFKLTLNPDGTWTQSVLHDFSGIDGSGLVGGLTFDPAGNLYGAAANGGAHGAGVVYKLTPNPDGSWTESNIYDFGGGSDGTYPDHASLVFDAAGNLYGVTASGGRGKCNFFGSGCGTVFKLTPSPDGTWTKTLLHTFNGREGGTPESTLLFDRAGNLYGTTEYHSTYKNGSVFQLTPNPDGTWTKKVLHRFHGHFDGANPDAGVIADAAGNLYGTAALGGTAKCNCGTVFKIVSDQNGGWTRSVLHRFHGKDGNNPYGGLIFDRAGNLYGTTQFGGKHGGGVVFEITP